MYNKETDNQRILDGWLKHKPIIYVDYEDQDGNAGDAKILSIGKSQWCSGKDYTDYSVKVWRWADKGKKWSRQCEELPLWRVLDAARLLLAIINEKDSGMEERLVKGREDDKEDLMAFIQENLKLYAPKINALRDLLGATQKTMSNGSPNIFSFATSELSQDAMLSWLLQWADSSNMDKDSQLCHLGQSLVSLYTGIDPNAIKKVSVGRQWEGIDIWVEINDDVFLLIEDKTFTTAHGDQLTRYKEVAEQEYKGKRKIFCAYTKTGNEPKSILDFIAHQGYKTVGRQDLLQLLKEYGGNNPMVCDFSVHLQDLENATNLYRKLPVKDWNDALTWQGFYKELENYLDELGWDYVANPSGGFFGAWWHFISSKDNDVKMYLQFEQKKFCIKIECCADSDYRSESRTRYHRILMAKAEELGLAVNRPGRFGNGNYMTIGVVDSSCIFGDGVIDMSQVVNKLKDFEHLVDECMRD